MTDKHQHESHKSIQIRLKKANGHLKKVIQMIEDGEPCLKISQQLFAVERAITQAKKNIIHDHIEHCLDVSLSEGHEANLEEFKEITKYL